MKTMSFKRAQVATSTSNDSDLQKGAERASQSGRTREIPFVRPGLLESEEYEWTTALNMPGLIIAPQTTEPPAVIPPQSERHPLGEVLETEDGDTTSVCQLPGGLCADSVPLPFRRAGDRPRDELEEVDEYTDIAAMQMPGALIEACVETQNPVEHRSVRGLCATCIHNNACDFPRPAGGVWRCEEYA